MNILAADTSSEVASVALKTENSYEERLISGCFSPSEDLLGVFEELLESAGITMKDLELLAVTKGPGSFTGLRIAMASMKGIASALSIPLVSIPTLDVIYDTVRDYPGPVLSTIDARKKKFYFSVKENGKTLIEDRDGNPEDAIVSLGKDLPVPMLITGPDALLFAEKLSMIDDSMPFIIDSSSPRNLSRSLIKLAIEKYRKDGADDIGEGPVYIRRSDAEEALERKIKENADGRL